LASLLAWSFKIIGAMKNLINVFIFLTLFTFFPSHSAVSSAGTSFTEDSLIVWCSPDLFELANTWIETYSGINSGIYTSLHIVPAGNIGSPITTSGRIGFISKDFIQEIEGDLAWKMVVGRDVIVPVMNPDNPFLDEIYNKGISREKFNLAYSSGVIPTWGILLGDDKVFTPVNSYCMKDESVYNNLSEFMQTDHFTTSTNEVSDINELLDKITRDQFGLGFCRLADIIDSDNNRFDVRVKLVPIDINANNKVDYFENIYSNINDFTRGVWIGKYPREFSSSIYTVAGGQPNKENDLAFLEWVLTDGQAFLDNNGYTELVSTEKYQKIQSLSVEELTIGELNNKPKTAETILLILIIGLVGGIVVFTTMFFFRSRGKEIFTIPHQKIAAFTEHSVKAPGGLFYDKTHTWAFMEKDGSVRIGIDDFLQHITGRITKTNMKVKDDRIIKGKPFMSIIQEGKQLDLYSPVSGTIMSHNDRLENDCSVLNSSPYSDGWVYIVKPDNWLQDIRTYFMEEKYRGWLKNEFPRLKKFLSSIQQPERLDSLQLIMQDGGELRDNLLELLGPEEWEEFQTGFIDASQK
jgi:glycine cleavage system H lipoate-binding protein/ABC-type phosphate transport system substrate-binding protein